MEEEQGSEAETGDEKLPARRVFLRLGVIHPIIESLLTTVVIVVLILLQRSDSMMPSPVSVLMFVSLFVLPYSVSIYYLGAEVMVREDRRRAGTAFALVCISYFVAVAFWILVIVGDSVGPDYEKALAASVFLLPPLQYMITVLWLSRLRILLLRSLLIIAFYYLTMFGIAGVAFS